MTTSFSQSPFNRTVNAVGTQLSYSNIQEPGAYLCHWSGHLLRIVEGAFEPGRTPAMGIRAHAPLTVTKISANPYITRSEARLLAADLDLMVNFEGIDAAGIAAEK